MLLRYTRQIVLTTFALLVATVLGAQSAPPSIRSIDPPEWWINMPAPMLLVHGESLGNAVFSLSDTALEVASTTISSNGHWAVVRLKGAPARAETIAVTATTAQGHASADYKFAPRRGPKDGVAGFSSQDVMYLIMTDRFADSNAGRAAQTAEPAAPRGWHGGNLAGITQHLDYLEKLGITAVWITPVYQNHNPDSYHGYGATDLYKVDEHFGTLKDLKDLADNLHRRHMKLVLDVVPNHLGAEHPWVYDEPEPDWFHGTKAQHSIAQGEFTPLINPHAAWRDQKDILEGWFADRHPDMNQENPDAATYLIQNAIWWVEQTGADGLRIDTFPYVGRPFWHSFHASLHALYPALTTVGEVFNGNPVITSAFAGGVKRTDLNGLVDTGLTTPFDFPTYFALRDVFLHGAPMSHLAEVLGQDALYPHPEQLVPFLGNHDTKRFMGEDGATEEKLKLAFAVLLTMRGMPQIYSGDEIAMAGGDDPDNRRDFPGGFAPSAQSAFVESRRSNGQQEMFAWVRQLLSLRAKHNELRQGEEQVLYADADAMVYVRGNGLEGGCSAGLGRIVVAVNRSGTPKTIPFPTDNTSLAGCKAEAPLLGQPTFANGSATLPPGFALISWH